MYEVLLATGDHKSADIMLNDGIRRNEVPSILSGYVSYLKKCYASGDQKSADITLNKVPSSLSGNVSHRKKRYRAKKNDVLVSDT